LSAQEGLVELVQQQQLLVAIHHLTQLFLLAVEQEVHKQVMPDQLVVVVAVVEVEMVVEVTLN